ncbi:hypothetical protein TUBRATIS_006290 [Tubulinosema ratisbonensis]|uniref:Uncharacterized protein n=1 Tax=Tubulinosema ratisbonensis TaxID=291195 RepID=A0A437ANQ4_9MICR|nr:hypothetical protein TUBRATIS_006290 [Tubulinosema ratisbonensis]
MTEIHKKIEILSERIKNSSYLEDKLLSLEELNIIADTYPDLVAVSISDHIFSTFDDNTHFMEIYILKKGFTCEIGQELSEIFFKNHNTLSKIYDTLFMHLKNENFDYSDLIIELLLILFVHSLNLPNSIKILDYHSFINSLLVNQLKKTNLNINFYKIISKNNSIKNENFFLELQSIFLKNSNDYANLNNLLILLLENNYFIFVSLFLINNPSLSISLGFLNSFEIILNSLANGVNESIGTLIFLLKDNFMNQRLFLEHKIPRNILFLISDLFLENNFNFLPNYIKDNNYKGMYHTLLFNDSNIELVIDNLINHFHKKNDYFYLLVYLIFKKRNETSLLNKYKDDWLVLSFYSYFYSFTLNSKINIINSEKDILSLLIFKIKNESVIKNELIIYLYKEFTTSLIIKSLSLFYLMINNILVEKNEFVILFYLKESMNYICKIEYLPQEIISDLVILINNLISNLIFDKSHVLICINNIKEINQVNNINQSNETNQHKEYYEEINQINKINEKSNQNNEINEEINKKVENESNNSNFIKDLKSNLEDRTKKYKKIIDKFINKEEENDVHDL